jgi:hypothetical protein
MLGCRSVRHFSASCRNSSRCDTRLGPLVAHHLNRHVFPLGVQGLIDHAKTALAQAAHDSVGTDELGQRVVAGLPILRGSELLRGGTVCLKQPKTFPYRLRLLGKTPRVFVLVRLLARLPASTHFQADQFREQMAEVLLGKPFEEILDAGTLPIAEPLFESVAARVELPSHIEG